MEPYCADITSEEVRTLEELLKPPEDEAEHYKVKTPGLDRHDGEQEGSEMPQNQRSQSYISSSFFSLSSLLTVPLTHADTQVLALSFLPSTPLHPKASSSVRSSLCLCHPLCFGSKIHQLLPLQPLNTCFPLEGFSLPFLLDAPGGM